MHDTYNQTVQMRRRVRVHYAQKDHNLGIKQNSRAFLALRVMHNM